MRGLGWCRSAGTTPRLFLCVSRGSILSSGLSLWLIVFPSDVLHHSGLLQNISEVCISESANPIQLSITVLNHSGLSPTSAPNNDPIYDASKTCDSDAIYYVYPKDCSLNCNVIYAVEVWEIQSLCTARWSSEHQKH
ncbi:hypothetical protein L5515_003336 [Caenorhabditis briggsae]|uniref:Uncharacterized protein n=1 Tax=Caenorhabditis briggsae TaxID=6238 RepID=A0AAE9EIZ1_CAEBR|nr:hypothetical protein L5515_003336 [Caenorhabditis briggsae]